MYSIEVRLKNPGPAKYLIQSVQRDDLNEAFRIAGTLADVTDKDHFVQIRNDVNEVIANFGLVGLS